MHSIVLLKDTMLMNDDAFYRQLVYRYQHNQATDEELELFFQLLREGKLDNYLSQAMDTEAGIEHVAAGPAPVRRLFPWKRVVAAAVMLVMLSGGAYFLFNNKRSSQTAAREQQEVKSDLVPGGSKAILTLADGKQIVLNDVPNGTITQQGATQVNKSGAGITYNASDSPANSALAKAPLTFNTISTPRGGQYQVVLPDGSKVWLNAASSLRFPTAFTGEERRVEINGEAYFEIVTVRLPAGKKMPFKVSVNNKAEVEVLGTHFNVMAYDDEGAIETTLLEGRVKVGSSNRQPVILKPGEQASLSHSSHKSQIIPVQTVDVQTAVAWKEGYFRFNNTPVKTIMRQAARWYNAEIIYQGNVDDESFSGAVPRSENISSLLRILELTKTIRFTINERKIIVRPY
jgi:ferric-dicitrate binding protein FerR (iron transport regulator)